MLVPALIGMMSLSIPSIQALQCSVGTSIPDGQGGVINQVTSQSCSTECYATYTKLTDTPIGSIVGGCASGSACALANQGPIYFANQWVAVTCCNSTDNCNSQDWGAGQYNWNQTTVPPAATTIPTTQQPTQSSSTQQPTSIPTSSDNPTGNPTTTPTKQPVGGNPTPSATTNPPTSRLSPFNSAPSVLISPVVLLVAIGLSLIL